jgi:pimeloyl-ACP methyl ester carboxylesterase
VLVALGGGRLVSPLWWRAGSHKPGPLPAGTVLHLESDGPPDASPLLCTHSWGVTSAQWQVWQPLMGPECRLVVWDVPGLGGSTRPTTADESLEKMAQALEAILTFLGPRPVLLVGHSIGGMLLLTLCRLFPEALGARVCGLVLVHTTDTNPVRMTARRLRYMSSFREI